MKKIKINKIKTGFSLSLYCLFVLLFSLLIISLTFLNNLFLIFGLSLDLLLLILILSDFIITPNFKKHLSFEIVYPKYFKISSYNEISVIINNNTYYDLDISFLFDLDNAFLDDYSYKYHKLIKKTQNNIKLQLFAKRRGEFIISNIFIKTRGVLRFTYHYIKFPYEKIIIVIPRTNEIKESFSVVKNKIAADLGNVNNKLSGGDTNFEMLREYTKGDDLNKIDWKATARFRKPVSRIYTDENSFDVNIMVDCGRVTTAEIKGLSLLDYALKTAIYLSFAALNANDKVSLLAFSDKILKYIPLTKNKSDIKKYDILLSDIKETIQEPDYDKAFTFINSKLSKRSMIVFLTDIIDDSNFKVLYKNLLYLRKKHIVLLTLLKDNEIYSNANAITGRNVSLYTKTAAIDLVLCREKVIEKFRRIGVEVLDVNPLDLFVKLINKYIEIKNKH